MDKKNTTLPEQQQGVGRINRDNPGGNEVPIRDISYIDMQEGDMNNGELGGNFMQANDGTGKEGLQEL